MTSRLLLAALVLTVAAACAGWPGPQPASTPFPGALVPREPLSEPALVPGVTGLVVRATAAAAALQQDIPILPLAGLDPAAARAQAIALNDTRFREDLYSASGAPVRSEIFGVYPARESDLTEATLRCALSACYRVEMYNYTFNLTTVGIVDVDNNALLAVSKLPDSQPDIPPHLQQLALDIAVNAPEVSAALGFTPSADLALMEATKTALNQTRCQRSRHLCVAPTFVQGDRALWAIVDLTDGVLVGVRWTDLGPLPEGAVTERSLQNEVVTTMYCERNTAFERDGWQFNYMLTSSDGLRLAEVQYQGQPVLANAKLVDFHVSYSADQGFGYSDAVGCPVFSQAAVVAFQGPTITDLREEGAVAGFRLEQKFWSDLWPLPCNYYYVQRFDFYADGRFRVTAGNVGRGCGDAGVYRPVLRLAFAGENTFAAWDGTAWQDWAAEAWALQRDGATTDEGYQYRLLGGAGGGYHVVPGAGQFDDGGRGDDAFVYVSRRHSDRDEGESDLVTIGPCCNTDQAQGPEKFLNGESIAESELVLWYVPQLVIDGRPGREYCWASASLASGVYVADTFPCFAGPMFVPLRP